MVDTAVSGPIRCGDGGGDEGSDHDVVFVGVAVEEGDKPGEQGREYTGPGVAGRVPHLFGGRTVQEQPNMRDAEAAHGADAIGAQLSRHCH
jgi:hypothetical protein